MGTMHGGFPKDGVIDSPLGKTTADSQGAAVSGVRMDVSRAYAGIPALLQKVIDEKDAASWKEIACKIDYIYDNLDHSLAGSVSLGSVYEATFCYADKAFNGGAYTGPGEVTSDPNSIHAYFDAVSRGAPSLDFTLYVPVGYGSLEGVRIPNVEETEDPGRIFTAHFNGGMEVW